MSSTRYEIALAAAKLAAKIAIEAREAHSRAYRTFSGDEPEKEAAYHAADRAAQAANAELFAAVKADRGN